MQTTSGEQPGCPVSQRRAEGLLLGRRTQRRPSGPARVQEAEAARGAAVSRLSARAGTAGPCSTTLTPNAAVKGQFCAVTVFGPTTAFVLKQRSR